jgi:peptidoglycan hydrolase CwlO-like protein
MLNKLFLLSLLLLFSAPCFLYSESVQPKDQLINELLMLEMQLSNLVNQIKAYESLISDLQYQMQSLNEYITSLESQAMQDLSSLESLKKTLSDQTELSKNYETQLAVQVQQYQILSERFAELESLLKAYDWKEKFLWAGIIILPIVGALLGHFVWR